MPVIAQIIVRDIRNSGDSDSDAGDAQQEGTLQCGVDTLAVSVAI
jgi:hypothetical protein